MQTREVESNVKLLDWPAIDNRLGIRVLVGFAVVFLATWVVQIALGVGINMVMRWLAVTPNVRVFVGTTLTRGGILAAALFFSALGLRKMTGLRMTEVAFRLHPGWWQDLIFGCLLATIPMVIIFVIEVANGWLVVERWSWRTEPLDAWLRSLWLSLLSNLDAGVGEEVMFRGYLLTGLNKAWRKWIGLIVMAIPFAAVHLMVSGAQETHWLLFTVLLCLPGIVLGYAYLRAGSLWLPIGIHFTWDLAYDLLNLTGGPHQGLFGAVTRQQGPEWFVGTSYGIEVGLAGVVVAALVWIGAWGWTYRRNRQVQGQPLMVA